MHTLQTLTFTVSNIFIDDQDIGIIEVTMVTISSFGDVKGCHTDKPADFQWQLSNAYDNLYVSLMDWPFIYIDGGSDIDLVII